MPRQKAEPILPCKAGIEYCTPPSFSSHMLSPILNDGNLYYRPGGGGKETLSRGRNAVSAYLTSKQILHAGFAEQSTAFFFTQ